MTPSLYPRPWLLQGVLSGAAVAGGLATGHAVGPLLSLPRSRPAAASRAVRVTLLTLAGVVAGCALLANYQWQVDVRRLMAIDGRAAPYLASVVPVAAVTAYALILVVRSVRRGLQGYAGLVSRVVPRRVRRLVHAIIAMAVTVMVLDVVVATELVAAANDRLIAADASSDPDVQPPRSGALSGSPASLVPWDTLGRMGRRFVATAPTTRQLHAFSGMPARSPIRVYVGLQSAASVHARADLAVDELERTGAFERDVLLVITPTGTGSVNGHAVAPVE